MHGNADRRDKKSVLKIESRNVLLNQIKGKACERSLAEGKSHNFPTVLPEHLAEHAEEALKSRYNLELLDIARSRSGSSKID